MTILVASPTIFSRNPVSLVISQALKVNRLLAKSQKAPLVKGGWGDRRRDESNMCNI